MNPYIALAWLVSVVLGVGGGYLYGEHAQKNADEAAKVGVMETRIQQANDTAKQDNQTAATAEAKRDQVRVAYRTIREEAIPYVQTHAALTECGLDADGLRLYNARPGDFAPAAGQSDGAVPGPAGGQGREALHDPAQQPGPGGAVLRLPGQAKGAGGVGLEGGNQ